MAKETILQTEGLCKEVANCIKNAYDRGYKQGFKDGNYDKEFYCNLNFKHGTNKGLDEAWECARKIVEDVVEPHFESAYMVDIFRCESAITAMMNNSAPEAIAKIKEYEEKQKDDSEVKVGYEVIDINFPDGGKGVVTFVSPIVIYILWYDGSTGRRKLEDVKKTGRIFPKIGELLKQLNEEEENEGNNS